MLIHTLCRAAEPVSTLVSNNNTFAFHLYAKINSGDGNVFFSPYSISTCLAMTYAGAAGNTASQMSKVLHFADKPADLPEAFADLQKQLPKPDPAFLEFNLANGLWAQKNHPFRPEYMEMAREQFGAKIEQVNFQTDAEPTRNEINSWVSDQTKGKITDLIGPGALNASTRLVLVNAIYFKGRWEKPFRKQATADAPFAVAADKKIQVKMMTMESEFAYGETEDLQWLEMDYQADSGATPLSMMVLLPGKVDGLPNLERSLNVTSLVKWMASRTKEKVKVFLPRFKTTSQFMLSGTLSAMGMKDAFSGAADFSGMDGQRDLSISAVIHKAFVEVNEEGTEAAAATAVAVSRAAVMRSRPAPVFRADHPFIFLIRDNQTGSILFMGRITDPTK